MNTEVLDDGDAALQALDAVGAPALPQVVDHVAVARLYGEPLFNLPTDLYIPPDALEVFLEAFQGPLDLLLYLIRKQNFNILDIPLADLTRQYLAYVDQIRKSNLEPGQFAHVGGDVGQAGFQSGAPGGFGREGRGVCRSGGLGQPRRARCDVLGQCGAGIAIDHLAGKAVAAVRLGLGVQPQAKTLDPLAARFDDGLRVAADQLDFQFAHRHAALRRACAGQDGAFVQGHLHQAFVQGACAHAHLHAGAHHVGGVELHQAAVRAVRILLGLPAQRLPQ